MWPEEVLAGWALPSSAFLFFIDLLAVKLN
jgi:hypothetical protein